MNNDNDLNFHSMTKLSGWLRWLSSGTCFSKNFLLLGVSETLFSSVICTPTPRVVKDGLFMIRRIIGSFKLFVIRNASLEKYFVACFEKANKWTAI